MFLYKGYLGYSRRVIVFSLQEVPAAFAAFSSWAPEIKIKPCNESMAGSFLLI